METSTHRALATLSAALVLTLALASPSLAVGGFEGVVISDSLEPAHLEIVPGTTVTWRNDDTERHRVRSREGPVRFDSGNLRPGESFSFTFHVEGAYPYYDHRDREDAAYLGMIVVAALPEAEGGPLPTEGEVAIIDRAFSPASLALATGARVTWRNDDGEAHTVTSTESDFDSGIMGSGDAFSTTFDSAGSYPYFCAIHPRMRGTITISDPDPDVAPVDPAASPGDGIPPAQVDVALADRAFAPAQVEIAAGATVSWSNDDSEGHTVTALDGAFDSGILTVGATFSHTFETPGRYDYFCAIHPGMRGSVTVLSARLPVGSG